MAHTAHVPHSITEAEYADANDEHMGYCPDCEDFTRECTEPDARQYKCPVCESRHVVGAEEALVMGLIDFGGDA